MQQLIFLSHVLAAVCLVALVLIQQGKGSDVGAAFGSGASQTMFGSIGSMSFLTKVTAVLAAIFFATSLTLGYLSSKQKQESLLSSIPVNTSTVPVQQAPVVPTIPVMPQNAPADNAVKK